MARELAWKQINHHRIRCCSECDWTFEPKTRPVGSTMGEMAKNFVEQCKREFEAHVCKKEK